MKSRIQFPALALVAALAVGCSPQAAFFHETTKVGFAATYNTSDSQPLSTSFGFKRRIVAVVPAQERVAVDDDRRHDENRGEAVSLVSKFYVRVGEFDEGVKITHQFASGIAAQKMTASGRSAAAVNALLHSQPVIVSPDSGETPEGQPAAEAVRARIRGALYLKDESPNPTTRMTKKEGRWTVEPITGDPPKPDDTPPKTKLVKDPATGKWIVVPIDSANPDAAPKTKLVKGADGKWRVVPIDTP